MNDGQFSIVPYADLAGREGLGAQLDAIFFEASATQSFAGTKARAAFRERWLGRYLQYYPGDALLAVGPDRQVAGYLVGCLEDPVATGRFGDVSHFNAFCPLIESYPAHLHINLAPEFRGRGIGSRLIEGFVRHARAAAVPGVHVVTAKGTRNVGFYQRNGFAPRAEACVDGRVLVLLGRSIGP